MRQNLSVQELQQDQRREQHQQEWRHQLHQQQNQGSPQRQQSYSPAPSSPATRFYHNASSSPVNHVYHQHSPSQQQQQQHQSQQPLHYRTNFGKDYLYRPPAPASPPATPTLLTQWNSQQGLERKRQMMLQRQQQFLTIPHLHNIKNGTHHNIDVSHEELPFDEREQSHRETYQQHQQQQQQNQPRGRKVQLSITTINAPNSPKRTTMSPRLPPSPQHQSKLPQRVKTMFESNDVNSNVNNTSRASPRPGNKWSAAPLRTAVVTPLTATREINSNNSNNIVTDINHEDRNTSPIARIANTNDGQQRFNRRYIPPQLNVLYSSPAKTSLPRMALNPTSPNAGRPSQQFANTPSTASNTTTSSQDDNYFVVNNSHIPDDDEIDYAFDDDTYETKSDDGDHGSMYVGYRLPSPRISDPRSQAFWESSVPAPATTARCNASSKQKPNFPVINMNTLTVDEASALTDIFQDEQVSVEVVDQAFQQNSHAQQQQDSSNVPTKVKSRKKDRSRTMHYDTLASKYFSNLQPRSPSQQPHPYHKENEHNETSATSTDASSSDRDFDSLEVAGVLRYMKDVENENNKHQQHANDAALQDQNAIRMKTTDDDSLFDFIDTSTTVSSAALTSDHNDQEPSVAAAKEDDQFLKSDAPPSPQNQGPPQPQSQQHQFPLYPNRFDSLLQAEDTDSTSHTSYEGADLPIGLQQRAQAAWKRGRSRAAASATTAAPDNLTSSSASPTTLPSVATTSSLTNLDLLAEMPTNASDNSDLNAAKTTATSQSEVEDSFVVPPMEKEKNTNSTTNTNGARANQDDGCRLTNDVMPSNANDSTCDASTTASCKSSLNETYAESNEREVEALIKDILLMGSEESTKPGRRKVKYNSRIRDYMRQKRKPQQLKGEGQLSTSNEEASQEASSPPKSDDRENTNQHVPLEKDGIVHDEETETNASESLTTDERISAKDNKKHTKSVSFHPEDRILAIKDKKGDDRFSGVWSFVGNRLNAVTTALGIEVDASSSAAQPGLTPSPLATPSTRSAFSSVESSSKTDQKSHSKDQYNELEQQQQVFSPWNILDYASDVLLGPATLTPCPNTSNQAACAAIPEPDTVIVTRGLSVPTLLEDDIRLVDLATQAAISLHRINGFEFDPSTDIDIANDIKFCVVDLKLPLGLMFQENENGCWVTNVLQEGSAAETKAVAAGDQLAAVEGISAIDMTIDEVAHLIRQPQSQVIELTFLRYVGPFRPQPGSIVEEEGYEVTARAGSPKLPRLRSNSLDSPSEFDRSAATGSSTRSCLQLPKRLQLGQQQQKHVSFRLPKTPSSSMTSSLQNGFASSSSNNPQVKGEVGKRTILPSFIRHNATIHNCSSPRHLLREEALVHDAVPKKKRSFSLFGLRRTRSTGSLG